MNETKDETIERLREEIKKERRMRRQMIWRLTETRDLLKENIQDTENPVLKAAYEAFLYIVLDVLDCNR